MVKRSKVMRPTKAALERELASARKCLSAVVTRLGLKVDPSRPTKFIAVVDEYREFNEALKGKAQRFDKLQLAVDVATGARIVKCSDRYCNHPASCVGNFRDDPRPSAKCSACCLHNQPCTPIVKWVIQNGRLP